MHFGPSGNLLATWVGGWRGEGKKNESRISQAAVHSKHPSIYNSTIFSLWRRDSFAGGWQMKSRQKSKLFKLWRRTEPVTCCVFALQSVRSKLNHDGSPESRWRNTAVAEWRTRWASDQQQDAFVCVVSVFLNKIRFHVLFLKGRSTETPERLTESSSTYSRVIWTFMNSKWETATSSSVIIGRVQPGNNHSPNEIKSNFMLINHHKMLRHVNSLGWSEQQLCNEHASFLEHGTRAGLVSTRWGCLSDTKINQNTKMTLLTMSLFDQQQQEQQVLNISVGKVRFILEIVQSSVQFGS